MHPKQAILSKNADLHNIHKNKRCFILATGPSINRQNLKPLKDEICFSLSNFFVHPDFAVMRPQYHCIAPYIHNCPEQDWQAWMKRADAHIGYATVFCGLSDYDRNQRDGLFEGRQLHFIDFSGIWKNLAADGVDLTRPLPGPQSIPVMAIMIAIYMGIRQIYLLGCDHDWLTHMHESKHFYTEGEHIISRRGHNEWEGADVETECHCLIKLWQQYKCLKQISDGKNVEIIPEFCTQISAMNTLQ